MYLVVVDKIRLNWFFGNSGRGHGVKVIKMYVYKLNNNCLGRFNALIIHSNYTLPPT